MKSFRKIGLIAIALSFFVSIFGLQGESWAAETPDYQIGVTPTQNLIGELKPGDKYEGNLKVKNTGLQKFEYEISFAPYTVTDEKYNPSFSTDTKYNDMAEWITVDEDAGELDAGAEREVHYVVEVPGDAHGGAQMATILITMKTPSSEQDSTAVETVRQLGFIVAANVDGDIIKSAKILENSVPSFLFDPPIFGTSLVENTGNVYTVAEYKLQVFPLFSDEEVFTNEETPDKNIIFPETKRYNEIKWEDAPKLGIFRVKQTIKIFDEVSEVEKLVFLCPIWFLFIVILIIFMVIFWIVSRIMHRKKEA